MTKKTKTTRKTVSKKKTQAKAAPAKAKRTKKKKPPVQNTEPKEFRLKIKPVVEVFWSYNAKSWVVSCTAETGKPMSMKVSHYEMAESVKQKALEKRDVNPIYWMAGIRKHVDDVLPISELRQVLLPVPGLTHGTVDGTEIWYVWLPGTNSNDQPATPLWTTTIKTFTRESLKELRDLIYVYHAGYEYALKLMGGNGKK